MKLDEVNDAAAEAENATALRAAMRQLKAKQWGSTQADIKTKRIQDERKLRASVDRVDGRKIKHGHDREAQFNVKVRKDLLEELREHCKLSGVSLADWMESTLLEWRGKR